MSSLRRTLMGLLLAAVGGGAALVPALPAAASSAGCDFTMVSLESRNLEKDGGTDWVWLKVDDAWYPAGGTAVAYTNTYVTHTAAAFANPKMGFTGTLDVKIVLDTWPSNTTVDTIQVACSPVNNLVRSLGDGDALYDLTYSVS